MDHSIFGTTPGPSTSVTDGQPLNLAHQINTTAPCWALGIRFYRGNLDITGTITGRLWQITGAGAGTAIPGTDVTFDIGDTTGWKEALFADPVELAIANYKPTVRFPDRWPLTASYWEAGGAGENGHTSGPLTAPNAAGATDGQGSFSAGALTVYPATGASNKANYWVDLLVTDTDPSSGPEGGVVAEYTVAQDEIGVHAIALVADTETIVRFADNVSTVEIVNMTGTAPVYFTVDKDAVSVAGNDTQLLPAKIGSVEAPSPGQQATVVRLISPGTPTISVTRQPLRRT